MDQLSDPSFYYVYEKGQLHAPHSKKRRVVESGISQPSKRFQPDEEYKGSNLNATTSDQLPSPQQVTEIVSLKSLAMSFVARNILCVESLVSFPELIGKELFLEVSQLGLFSASSEPCKRILKLFSDAFGSSVAEELSLGNRVSNLAFCFEPLTSFEHLTKLDLGGCKIWNINDECLAFISHLYSLTYLSLKSTGIDNDGLRILTTVIAVYKKGLLQLKVLDLSCNQLINQKSLQFLRRFPSLKALNLSNTSVFSISLEEQKNLHLTLLRGNLEYPFGKISVTNKGWVADIFNDWIAEEGRRMDALAATRNRPSIPPPAQDRLIAVNFYRRSKASGPGKKKLSIPLDQVMPGFHTTHNKIACKPFVKAASDDHRTHMHTVHLVSADLIVEVNGIKRVKDISGPSAGEGETESESLSYATVEGCSSGNTSLSRCAVIKTVTEHSAAGSGANRYVSQSLSNSRNAVPSSAECKFFQGEVGLTIIRKNVSFDAKEPVSTCNKPVDHSESINRNWACGAEKGPKSLWAAMNSGLW